MGTAQSRNRRKKEDPIPPGMLRIYINGTEHKIHCYPHITVGNFVRYLREELNVPSLSDMIVIHQHLVVQPDRDKSLSLEQYNLKNNSLISVYISEPPSEHNHDQKQQQLSAAELRQRCLRERQRHEPPLQKRFSSQTLITDEKQRHLRKHCSRMSINSDYVHQISDVDLVTQEVSDQCFQLSCKHGMTKETLYRYARTQYESGHNVVRCPHLDHDGKPCGALWYHPQVKNVLLFGNETDEKKHSERSDSSLSSVSLHDILELDQLCNHNAIRSKCDTAQCPQCAVAIYRDKGQIAHSLRTTCPACSCAFCWQCQSKLPSPASTCPNRCALSFYDEVLVILMECSTKTIGRIKGVPSVRCCPQCLQLITHTDACKHVQCSQCQCQFCFVCMGVWDGEWRCGHYTDVCPIAPRGLH